MTEACRSRVKDHFLGKHTVAAHSALTRGGSVLNLQPETGRGMANTTPSFHIKNAFAG